MYAIRVDTTQGLLEIELTGRLVTAEALRAMSQAFTLAEAGSLRAALCDVRGLERGPAGTMVVAASLAVRFQPGLKLAFVAQDSQLRFLNRILRFSGIRQGVRAFTSDAEAEEWLLPAVRAVRKPSSTEHRHAEQILGPAAAPISSAALRELATISTESRHSAA